MLVPFVNYLVILDSDGDRLLAKYYDGRSKAEQTITEAALQKKTKSISGRGEGEVLQMEGEVVVWRAGQDVKFFLGGVNEENELILVGVLDAVYDSVSLLLREQVVKRTMIDNLELVLLTIDECIDNGHIMELDSTSISARVLMRAAEGGNAAGDLSISQALGMARDQLLKSMSNKGDGF